jgi:hypothetical protein
LLAARGNGLEFGLDPGDLGGLAAAFHEQHAAGLDRAVIVQLGCSGKRAAVRGAASSSPSMTRRRPPPAADPASCPFPSPEGGLVMKRIRLPRLPRRRAREPQPPRPKPVARPASGVLRGSGGLALAAIADLVAAASVASFMESYRALYE